jgi:hypothetical protein
VPTTSSNPSHDRRLKLCLYLSRTLFNSVMNCVCYVVLKNVCYVVLNNVCYVLLNNIWYVLLKNVCLMLKRGGILTIWERGYHIPRSAHNQTRCYVSSERKTVYQTNYLCFSSQTKVKLLASKHSTKPGPSHVSTYTVVVEPSCMRWATNETLSLCSCSLAQPAQLYFFSRKGG